LISVTSALSSLLVAWALEGSPLSSSSDFSSSVSGYDTTSSTTLSSSPIYALSFAFLSSSSFFLFSSAFFFLFSSSSYFCLSTSPATLSLTLLYRAFNSFSLGCFSQGMAIGGFWDPRLPHITKDEPIQKRAWRIK